MPGPTLYYIRHGETDWNVEGRLQGRHDVAINQAGRRQAAACATILLDLLAGDGRKPAGCDYVSSPLIRARETMELMRAALGLDANTYRIDARLRELSFGQWDGLTIEEVRARDPQSLAARERDKWRFVPPDGESYAEVCARMRDWYATLAGAAVVVAHGGTARALVALLGISPPETAMLMEIGQGMVYRFVDGRMARYG